jgi:hypothetical protein
VSSVELSTNPELGAVYLGEDPEQAKFMSPLEKAAAAKIKADPNFVVHEAYAWGMLGPVNGNHFINTNPRTPEASTPDNSSDVSPRVTVPTLPDAATPVRASIASLSTFPTAPEAATPVRAIVRVGATVPTNPEANAVNTASDSL